MSYGLGDFFGYMFSFLCFQDFERINFHDSASKRLVEPGIMQWCLADCVP